MILHPLRRVLWGDTWKHTAEKRQKNETSVIMHPLRQAIWRYIWKHIVEKNQINATNVTFYLLNEVIWGNILNTHTGEKPNKCNQCDYTSSQAKNLGGHMKKHVWWLIVLHKNAVKRSLRAPSVQINVNINRHQGTMPTIDQYPNCFKCTNTQSSLPLPSYNH